MMLVVSEQAVEDCLGLEELVDVVGEALAVQADGEVTRPDRPHFPVGQELGGDDQLGTGIAMPAYSPSDSREECAADLRDRDVQARAVDDPAAAVEGADTVVCDARRSCSDRWGGGRGPVRERSRPGGRGRVRPDGSHARFIDPRTKSFSLDDSESRTTIVMRNRARGWPRRDQYGVG